MTLSTDITKVSADAATMHAIIHGNATATVVTDNGTVPSLANRLAQVGTGAVKGAWVTATAYVLNDVVLQGGLYYRCAVAHTSGTFATDLAAAKWVAHVSYAGLLQVANALSELSGVLATAQTNLGVYSKAAVDAAVAAQNPVGSVQAYAGSAAPTGFLLCDGSAVSRTTYAALFAALSTTYGAGDGSTTFNVPNLLGRLVVGDGTGAQAGTSGTGIITGGTALTARARGAFGGEETHVLAAAELPAHQHGLLSNDGSVTASGNSDMGTGDSLAKQCNQGGNEKYALMKSPGALAATIGKSGPVGSGTAHNTMPPFTVLKYIIRAL